MPHPPPASVSSLYAHVPFCVRKCGYCAFYSEPPENHHATERYVAALLRELARLPRPAAPHTVFFGGGTPSLLSLPLWEQILNTLEAAGWSQAAEWTVECNPATLTPDKARLLHERGVNRISLGVQSFDDRLLARLGRVHTRDMITQSFDLLRAAGFDNINLDLMFGIPGQSLELWRETLRQACALGCEHLSSYEVTYEEDTPLFAELHAGQFDVDEDLVCAMYEALLEDADRAGFEAYEVSNLARRQPDDASAEVPALACRHNVNYWRGGAYFGLGPSATSYVAGVRRTNWANTRRYCELLEQGLPPVESEETLPPLARAGELAAFGLRLAAGWPFADFERLTGYDLRAHWRAEMDQLLRRGHARETRDRFQLTRQGLRFADAAAELFLRPE